jgi:hypothetical protein
MLAWSEKWLAGRKAYQIGALNGGGSRPDRRMMIHMSVRQVDLFEGFLRQPNRLQYCDKIEEDVRCLLTIWSLEPPHSANAVVFPGFSALGIAYLFLH